MKPQDRYIVLYKPTGKLVSVMRKAFDGNVHEYIDDKPSVLKPVKPKEAIQQPTPPKKPLDNNVIPSVAIVEDKSTPKSRLEVLRAIGWPKLNSVERKEYQLLNV